MVYQETANDIVRSVLDGYNATLIAYGMTGSGKTYTMMKNYSAENMKNTGVIPQAIQNIFGYIQADDEHQFAVTMSYLPLDTWRTTRAHERDAEKEQDQIKPLGEVKSGIRTVKDGIKWQTSGAISCKCEDEKLELANEENALELERHTNELQHANEIEDIRPPRTK